MATWNEIEKNFNLVKDKKTKGWQKLKKLSEILADAYYLDPERASDMWQYLIDEHYNDDADCPQYYGAALFYYIVIKQKTLKTDEAVHLLTMEPSRLEQVLLQGYSGGTQNELINILVKEYILAESISDAVTIIQISLETYGGLLSAGYNCEKLMMRLKASLDTWIDEESEYKNDVVTFWEELSELPNDYISGYAKVALCRMKDNNDNELLMDCIAIAAEQHLCTEFLLLLYEAKGRINEKYLIEQWENYCNSLEEGQWPPYFYYQANAGEAANEENTVWYGKLISQSDDILIKYFGGVDITRSDFLYEVIYQWMDNDNWEAFEKYIALFINNVQNPTIFEDGILRNLRDYMKAYFYSDLMDVFDGLGRSTKEIVQKKHLEFCQSLAKISVMTIGSECHDMFHEQVRDFIEKSTGSLDILNSVGFEEVEDCRTAKEKLFDHIIKHAASGENDCNRKYFDIYHEAELEMRREGKDLCLEIAHDNNISDILFTKIWQQFSDKAEIICACVYNGENDKAIELVNKMISTVKYPGYDDCRQNGQWVGYSWEMETKNTMCWVVKAIDRKLSSSWERDSVTPEVLNSVVYLAKMVLPHLTKDGARELKNELTNIVDDDNEADDFINNLLADVKIFTTFPKPRGMGNAQIHNRISSEMIKGFEILSKMGRTDVISEILNMLYAVREKLKPIKLPLWMSHMLRGLNGKDCLELFNTNREVFSGWFREVAQNGNQSFEMRTILSWASKMRSECSENDIIEYRDLVYSICGSNRELQEGFQKIIKNQNSWF